MSLRPKGPRNQPPSDLTGAWTLKPLTEELSYDAWALADWYAILPEPVEVPVGWGAWDCEDNDTGALRGPRRSSTGEWDTYGSEPTAEELAWLQYETTTKEHEDRERRVSEAGTAIANERMLRRAPYGAQWDGGLGIWVDVDPEPDWGFRRTSA